MVAFQAVDPGSIPGRRSFAELIAIKKPMNNSETNEGIYTLQ